MDARAVLPDTAGHIGTCKGLLQPPDRRQERTLRGALASRSAPDCRNRSMKDLGLHLGLTEPLEAPWTTQPPSWASEEITNFSELPVVICGCQVKDGYAPKSGLSPLFRQRRSAVLAGLA